jgi:hypothetical protein
VTTLRNAFWCRPVRSVAPVSWRLAHSSRATIGSSRFGRLRKSACRSDRSMLVPYERTHAVRRRSLNAAARALPHCRHRHRRSRWSIRTLSGVSRWPLPQRSGSSMQVLLRRRSALENGTTVVLLVEITPPLPLATFCTNLHPDAPSAEARAGRSPAFGTSETESCCFCGGGAGTPKASEIEKASSRPPHNRPKQLKRLLVLRGVPEERPAD